MLFSVHLRASRHGIVTRIPGHFICKILPSPQLACSFARKSQSSVRARAALPPCAHDSLILLLSFEDCNCLLATATRIALIYITYCSSLSNNNITVRQFAGQSLLSGASRLLRLCQQTPFLRYHGGRRVGMVSILQFTRSRIRLLVAVS